MKEHEERSLVVFYRRATTKAHPIAHIRFHRGTPRWRKSDLAFYVGILKPLHVREVILFGGVLACTVFSISLCVSVKSLWVCEISRVESARANVRAQIKVHAADPTPRRRARARVTTLAHSRRALILRDSSRERKLPSVRRNCRFRLRGARALVLQALNYFAGL